MSNRERIVAILSDTIGVAETVTKRPPSHDRLPRLAMLAVEIDEASTWLVEGGNPIGPEAAMLIEVLMHIEKERAAGDGDRVTKWLAIAGALLPMVRNNGADAMGLADARPATSSVGRNG